MSKALLGVLVFAGIFLLIVSFFVFRFIYGIYRRIKSAKDMMEDNLKCRNYTGRRAQQYHYADNGKQQHSSRPMSEAAQDDEQPRRTQTQSGEVIIDNRSAKRENKKIFSDDDGEYVDFSES